MKDETTPDVWARPAQLAPEFVSRTRGRDLEARIDALAKRIDVLEREMKVKRADGAANCLAVGKIVDAAAHHS